MQRVRTYEEILADMNVKPVEEPVRKIRPATGLVQRGLQALAPAVDNPVGRGILTGLRYLSGASYPIWRGAAIGVTETEKQKQMSTGNKVSPLIPRLGGEGTNLIQQAVAQAEYAVKEPKKAAVMPQRIAASGDIAVKKAIDSIKKIPEGRGLGLAAIDTMDDIFGQNAHRIGQDTHEMTYDLPDQKQYGIKTLIKSGDKDAMNTWLRENNAVITKPTKIIYQASPIARIVENWVPTILDIGDPAMNEIFNLAVRPLGVAGRTIAKSRVGQPATTWGEKQVVKIADGLEKVNEAARNVKTGTDKLGHTVTVGDHLKTAGTAIESNRYLGVIVNKQSRDLARGGLKKIAGAMKGIGEWTGMTTGATNMLLRDKQELQVSNRIKAGMTDVLTGENKELNKAFARYEAAVPGTASHTKAKERVLFLSGGTETLPFDELVDLHNKLKVYSKEDRQAISAHAYTVLSGDANVVKGLGTSDTLLNTVPLPLAPEVIADVNPALGRLKSNIDLTQTFGLDDATVTTLSRVANIRNSGNTLGISDPLVMDDIRDFATILMEPQTSPTVTNRILKQLDLSPTTPNGANVHAHGHGVHLLNETLANKVYAADGLLETLRPKISDPLYQTLKQSIPKMQLYEDAAKAYSETVSNYNTMIQDVRQGVKTPTDLIRMQSDAVNSKLLSDGLKKTIRTLTATDLDDRFIKELVRNGPLDSIAPYIDNFEPMSSLAAPARVAERILADDATVSRIMARPEIAKKFRQARRLSVAAPIDLAQARTYLVTKLAKEIVPAQANVLRNSVVNIGGDTFDIRVPDLINSIAEDNAILLRHNVPSLTSKLQDAKIGGLLEGLDPAFIGPGNQLLEGARGIAEQLPNATPNIVGVIARRQAKLAIAAEQGLDIPSINLAVRYALQESMMLGHIKESLDLLSPTARAASEGTHATIGYELLPKTLNETERLEKLTTILSTDQQAILDSVPNPATGQAFADINEVRDHAFTLPDGDPQRVELLQRIQHYDDLELDLSTYKETVRLKNAMAQNEDAAREAGEATTGGVSKIDQARMFNNNPSMRMRLGEVQNLERALLREAHNAQSAIHNKALYQNIAHSPDLSVAAPPEGQTHAAPYTGWVKLTSGDVQKGGANLKPWQMSNRWGDLEGRYVPPYLAAVLRNGANMQPNNPFLRYAVQPITQTVKFLGVGLSAAAIIRNSVSNLVSIQDALQLDSTSEAFIHWWRGFNEFRNNGKYAVELSQYSPNLLNRTTILSESLADLPPSLLDDATKNLPYERVKVLMAKAKVPFQKIGMRYNDFLFGTSESASRIAIGKYAMQKFGLNAQQATALAEQHMIDYTTAPAIVNILRRNLGLMPYMTYSYKMMGNMVKLAAEHPEIMAKQYTKIRLWNESVRPKYISEIEKESYPDYLNGQLMMQIPTNPYNEPDKKVDPIMLNAGYFFPQGIFNPMLSNSAADNGTPEQVVMSVMASNMNPIFSLIKAVDTGLNPMTGAAISPAGSTSTQKFLNNATYAAKTMIPLLRYGQKVIGGLEGRPASMNNPTITPYWASMITANRYSIDRGMEVKISRLQRQIQGQMGNVNKLLKLQEMEKLPIGEVRTNIDEGITLGLKRIAELRQQEYKLSDSALRIYGLRETLKNLGVTEKDAEIYERYIIDHNHDPDKNENFQRINQWLIDNPGKNVMDLFYETHPQMLNGQPTMPQPVMQPVQPMPARPVKPRVNQTNLRSSARKMTPTRGVPPRGSPIEAQGVPTPPVF